MKLAGEKTTLKIDFNNITTRELNIESLESSLNSILNGVNNIDLISNFKLEVVKYYNEQHCGYQCTANKFNIPSLTTVKKWVKKYLI